MDWLASEDSAEAKIVKTPWKVLVVDDDHEIFGVTKLALGHFEFEGRGLDIHYAKSAAAGQLFFEQHDDVAIALVDVVMETDDAGLRLVETVREDLENHYTRIVLRTGQPGFAPEVEIIKSYDIDGYKAKTELTQQSLVHCFYTSLRSYRDLVRIQQFQQGLEALIDSLLTMHTLESFEVITDSLLVQLRAVLSAYDSEFIIKLNSIEGGYVHENAFRHFAPADNGNEGKYKNIISNVLRGKTDVITDEYYAHYNGSRGYESVLLLIGPKTVNKFSKRLIALFSANVSVILERLLSEQ